MVIRYVDCQVLDVPSVHVGCIRVDHGHRQIGVSYNEMCV
jgi:hypothetical protein